MLHGEARYWEGVLSSCLAQSLLLGEITSFIEYKGETMPINSQLFSKRISRRGVLGTAAAIAATPAFAEVCPIGPPAHEKGPRVWMDLDQIELDAAYDQTVYAPLIGQILKRYASSSNEARARLGVPKRLAYGPTSVEALDLYPAKKPNAPIFVFIHGGAWLRGAGNPSAGGSPGPGDGETPP